MGQGFFCTILHAPQGISESGTAPMRLFLWFSHGKGLFVWYGAALAGGVTGAGLLEAPHQLTLPVSMPTCGEAAGPQISTLKSQIYLIQEEPS